MRKEWIFEIPAGLDKRKILVKIVETVPLDWSWAIGCLRPPQKLVHSGQVEVETGTGFAVELHSFTNPTVIGERNSRTGNLMSPNLMAVLVDRRLPGFISFKEAGYHSHTADVKIAKYIAANFFRKGYCGNILFFKHSQDRITPCYSAECLISFWPRHGAEDAGGTQKIRVTIEFDSKYYGKEEHVWFLVSKCRSLGLIEHSSAVSAEEAAVKDRPVGSSETASDAAERARKTKVQTAVENYENMTDSDRTIRSVEELAESIRALVDSGEATWGELGFTDNDILERLIAAAGE